MDVVCWVGTIFLPRAKRKQKKRSGQARSGQVSYLLLNVLE